MNVFNGPSLLRIQLFEIGCSIRFFHLYKLIGYEGILHGKECFLMEFF